VLAKFAARYNFSTWLWLIGLISLLALPPAAAAHPLDELFQVTYVVMAPNRITLQLELYPGVLIASQVLALIDTNSDDRISESESRAYVNLFLKDIIFELDGQPSPLTPTNFEFATPLDLRAGVGIIRYSQSPTSHHHLPEQVKISDLLTLGISGGLVPCPEALGIMLIAIGLNRILLGLGLIVAFSLGLAGVLIVIGILLVRSKLLVDRLGGLGGGWQKLLPITSAVIVILLGAGLAAKGVLAYWG
jgi:hypothetical protein